MLNIGCITLSIWVTLNLIASVLVVAQTMFFGGHTPALTSVLTAEEVASLGADVIATLDSIAVFANGTNTAFSLVSLLVIWLALRRKMSWAFWSLLGGFAIALLSGVSADYVVGMVAPEVNVISGIMLMTGFMFAALGLFRN